MGDTYKSIAKEELNIDVTQDDIEKFCETFENYSITFKTAKVSSSSSSSSKQKEKCYRTVRNAKGAYRRCNKLIKNGTYYNLCPACIKEVESMTPPAYITELLKGIREYYDITYAVEKLKLNEYMISNALSKYVYLIPIGEDEAVIYFGYFSTKWRHCIVAHITAEDDEICIDSTDLEKACTEVQMPPFTALKDFNEERIENFSQIESILTTKNKLIALKE